MVGSIDLHRSPAQTTDGTDMILEAVGSPTASAVFSRGSERYYSVELSLSLA